MILTCPNCNSQFKVSLEALGDKARDVRCSACGETWFEDSHVKESVDAGDSDIFEVDIDVDADDQDSDQGDAADHDEFEEIDIPDSIKPQEEDIADISVSSKKKVNDNNIGKKTSYAVAAVVFITVFAYLLLSSTSMMRSYPSMQAFYGVFGIKMELPSADKITFANLQANEHDGVIKVSGDIINLTGEPQALRMLEISLGDGSDDPKIKWYATPPKTFLESEESVKFSSEYKLETNDKSSHGVTKKNNHEGNKSEEEQYIRVRFVLKPALSTSNISSEPDVEHKSKFDHGTKTGAKDGGNNQAHHESGSGH